MCGIFGFTKFKKEDLEKARESLHTLSHRGPDQWNDYFDEDIYIGHQRLSILDLSEHGKQPMISPDEKISYCKSCAPQSGYKKKWYKVIGPEMQAWLTKECVQTV